MRYVSSVSCESGRRSGVVLLIVMAMLALFASLALSFVFYADSEAVSAQLAMSSMVKPQADLNEESLGAYVLKELLYPSENLYSATRGWELGRGIYSYNPYALNATPYNGPSRTTALSYNDPDFTNKITTLDNKAMVNYTYYHDPLALATDRSLNFTRTPEFADKIFMGPANRPPQPSYNITTAPNWIPPALRKNTYRFVGSGNPPWTAYDTNNLMLAQVAADGTVLMPSGYRPWNYTPTLTNKAWSDQRIFRYTSLRPDPGWNFVPIPGTNVVDPANPANVSYLDPRYPKNGNTPPTLITTFMPPDSEFLFGGPDVKNLPFGPGMAIPGGGGYFNNDSFWMYMGYPVMTAPNGKKYTMLVAPLVMDLSNRIHLGVHGNALGGPPLNLLTNTTTSTSNMGLGAPEVNPMHMHISTIAPPQVPPLISPVTENGKVVTITTQNLHGFSPGDSVTIYGVQTIVKGNLVPAPVYNGTYVVTSVPNQTSFTYNVAVAKLPASGNGFVFGTNLINEYSLLMQRRYGGVFYGTPAAWNAAPQRAFPNWTYGGVKGATTTTPIGVTANILNGAGPWFNPLDANGANSGVAGSIPVSSVSPIAGFTSTSANAVAAGANKAMFYSATAYPVGGNAAPPLTPGMTVIVGTGAAANTEAVQVINVNTTQNSFTANFTRAHPVRTPITTVGATTSTGAISPAKLGTPQKMNVNAVTGNLPTGGTWSIKPGMWVLVGTNGVYESVQVQDVSPPPPPILPKYIWASFTLPHPAGATVTLYPNTPLPNFVTTGWANGTGEIINSPLGFNPYGPNAPNARPISSDLEAMFRFGDMNGPATLSEIFRIMPNTLRSSVVRSRVTMASNHLDRITASPYFNFDRTTPGHYVTPTGTITAATAATPIVITTASTVGLTTGDMVVISGVGGNAAANGIWTITVTSATTFLLNGSTGLSAYTSGGTWARLSPTTGIWIASVVQTPLVTTFTTTENHNFTLNTTLRFRQTGTWYPNPTNVPPLPGIPVTSVKTPNTFTCSTALLKAYGYLVPAAGDLVTPVPTYSSPNSVTMTGSPWNSDYGADWRSNLGNLLKVNLSRQLTDFPAPTPIKPGDFGMIQASTKPAVSDRQQFARDIYNALVRATGAQDPNLAYPFGNAKTVQLVTPSAAYDYQACRFLGQLAVNIVDYIDNDDYVTAFQWYAPAIGTGEFVFGTELPRVVLNEAYAQQETTGTTYVWAELLNTFNLTQGSGVPPAAVNSLYPRDGGTALLYNNTGTTWPVYQLAIGNSTYQVNGSNLYPSTYLTDAPNSLGVVPTVKSITFDPKTNHGAFTLLYTSGSKVATIGPINFKPAATLVTRIQNALKPLVGNQPIDNINGVDYTDASPVSGGPALVNPIYVTYFTGGNGTLSVFGPGTKLLNIMNKAVPNPTIVPYSPAPTFSKQTTWSTSVTTMMVQPSNGTLNDPSQTNVGYYLLGPTAAPAAPHDPKFPTATNPQGSMSFSAAGGLTGVTLMLQKLANQHLPAQTDPWQPLYNPYVTVDYVDGLSVVQSGAATNSVANQKTWGRPQPYVATTSSFVNQGSGVAIWPASPPPAPPKLAGGVSQAPKSVVTTVRTVANHGFTTGQWVYIYGVGNANYNGLFQVTGTTLNTFTFNASMSGLPVSGGGFVTNAVQNTFFGQNNLSSATGFTRPNAYPWINPWITHLDRPPVNPLELLFVSAYRPHLLTQKYTGQTGLGNIQHYAPWNSNHVTANRQASLLFRALDLFGSAPRMNNTYSGGRIPGMININTMMDKNVFRALADPQDAALPNTSAYPYPLYTTAQADNAYGLLLTSRGASDSAMPTSDGVPFQPFASGNIETTVLRGNNAVFGLTASPAGNITPNLNTPYYQNGLLQKIFNNVSTTSNVFAIWFTVGFFEVVDDSVRPPRLGQEVGRTQNKQIRHRFFAVVDRSGMQLFPTVKLSANVAIPGTQPVTISTPLAGKIGNAPLLFQPGMLLEVDTGANAEVVAVMAIPAPTTSSFTAIFTKAHAAGAQIICRGNPGPQTNYTPHRDNNVVLHLSVIK